MIFTLTDQSGAIVATFFHSDQFYKAVDDLIESGVSMESCEDYIAQMNAPYEEIIEVLT